MYIEKLNITTFGQLNDFELELTPGVNLIEGANESGKSTLAAFIKFMFYGFTPKERAAYVGWDETCAAGTLTFNASGKRYRIERAVKAAGGSSFREAVQLVDLENNMPCHKGESPGLLFFGVDAEMFAATAFVSQLGGTTVSGAKVSEGIENLLFSADESVNTQRALDKLDAARVLLLHKNGKGGKLAELNDEIASLESRLDNALKTSAAIRAKEAKLADLREKESDTREKADALNEKLALFEAQTIAGGFDRLHALESKSAELKRQLDSSGAVESEPLNALRSAATRIKQLESQLDTLPEPSEPEGDPELDEVIAKFREHGGIDGLETEKADLAADSKAKTGAGIVLIVFAVGVLIFSGLGALMALFGLSRRLSIIGLLAGAAMLSFGVVLMNSAGRSKKKLADLDEEFDLDALEEEISRRDSARDAARTAEVIRTSVRDQLDEALSALRREFGIDKSEISAKLSELEREAGAAESLRIEYEKTAALTEQLRGQLERYDENEIRGKAVGEASGIDSSNLSAVRREAEFLTNSAKALEKYSLDLERELAGTPSGEDAARISDRLNELRSERSELEKKLAGLKLAHEKLREASEKLRSSVAPRLSSEAGRLMALITEDKYREVGVGGELALTCGTKSGQRSVDMLSAGTRDAAYLALRIALCGLIYRREAPPMIYDESFGRMDDARCRAMLKLAGESEQSLVMTASGREKGLAGAHNYIRI